MKGGHSHSLQGGQRRSRDLDTDYLGEAPVSPPALEKLGTKPSARNSSSVTPILVY